MNFIDKNIFGFKHYFLSITDTSAKENWITYKLVHYFESCLRDERTEGLLPFRFDKNPAQTTSTKETDIGVVILTKDPNPITIIEFEAKRLSATSINHQYVYGENRGGIERFKKEEHARHLSICGMFGYVQSKTIAYWTESINKWISEKSQSETGDLDWKSLDEKLYSIDSFEQVEKYNSVHSRKKLEPIRLYHYLINLN